MKKFMVVVSLILTMISSGLIDIYPETGVVVEAEGENVTVETETGDLFELTNPEYDVGDVIAMTMYGNGTDEVEDDMIIQTRNTGWKVN